jgi:hypothetical protein
VRVDWELFDRVADVAGERPHQQEAAVLGIVLDPRHHVGAAEALRVLERRVGDQCAGLEIVETQHHRGGAEVHRQAVDRPGRARDLLAVDQDAIAGTGHGRVEREPGVPCRDVGAPGQDA